MNDVIDFDKCIWSRGRTGRHQYVGPDLLSLEGATTLVKHIREFWAAKGYEVMAYMIGDGADDRACVYAVRSDLVNGFPRDWKSNAA